MTEPEQSAYRAICGQLNWICSQSRPDVSFDICQLCTKLSSATIKDVKRASKVLKKVKQDNVFIIFRKLDPPIKLLAFCDASYGNLDNGYSQGGMIIFLSDKNNKVVPIAWSAKNIKKVCRSTLTAETMILTDTIDICAWLSHILNEVVDTELGTT